MIVKLSQFVFKSFSEILPNDVLEVFVKINFSNGEYIFKCQQLTLNNKYSGYFSCQLNLFGNPKYFSSLLDNFSIEIYKL